MSTWRAWVDTDNLPHVEWTASVWQWVDTNKMRHDADVFLDVYNMVCFRREKDYVNADKARQRILDDGATVTIDEKGVIRVNY